MKIAVIGAGIVGITSAYALAQSGHQVSVFERNAAIAEEASFAHSGLLSPSLLHPLSHPRWPGRGWLNQFHAEAALSVNKNISLRELRWLLGWRKSMAADVFAERFKQLQQLTQYGLECLHQVCQDAGIAPEQAQGQLALFQSEAQLLAVQPKLDLLKSLGVGLQTLDRQQSQAIEPALDASYPMHAAVYFPQDEIANGRQFAHLLKERAIQQGVQFHFGSRLLAVHAGSPVQLEFAQMPSKQTFDLVVLCTGASSGPVAGLANGKLPLTQLHSYSISVPIRETLNAPRSAVFDYHRATSIGRMGARIRVSGGAELGCSPTKVRSKTTKLLFNALHTSFPGAANYQSGTQIWKGCSTFTPDGLPLVGPTATPGIWLNLGHGLNGWGMCCATAQMLSDLLGAGDSAMDPSALRPARFQI